MRGEIIKAMNIQECQHKGKYLGHPFCQLHSKVEAYMEIVEKLVNNLKGWR